MTIRQTRRDWLQTAALLTLAGSTGSARGASDPRDSRWNESITKGLKWLSRTQSSRGQWNTQVYPTALAALAGTALIASGSTTTQGPYAREIARASDFLISKSRDNGLIGDPHRLRSLGQQAEAFVRGERDIAGAAAILKRELCSLLDRAGRASA